MLESPDYAENLRRAVVKAIMEQSGVDIGNGERAAHVSVPDVCAVLTDIMAGFISSDASVQKPTDVRAVSEAWRKLLHKRLLDIINSGQRLPTFGGTAPPKHH